jgi:DNA-binding response OmpR family regulator
MNVLIIEDTKALAKTLADIVSNIGLDPEIVHDGLSGLEMLHKKIYDAVILDIMLPNINGFDLLHTIRDEGIDTPVLILTARNDVKDRVKGLDCGADYYLTKPFEIDEFIACLRAILRRQNNVPSEVLSYGDIELNTKNFELRCGENSIRLNTKEFHLLELFMSNPHQILSKELLINKVWGYDSEATDNNVEAYISFLRRKLSLLGSKVTISIKRKTGYYLEEQSND